MNGWLDSCSSYSMRQTMAHSHPLRALGTALVTAIVALMPLLSPSVASAQLDFSLTTFGPRNVVQGSPLYFVLTARLVSGTSPSFIPITVTGLPAGATVSFPDIAQTCCST